MEKGLIGETWGKFELFVDGKELCKYQKERRIISYQWNLIHLIEWFSENLKHVVGDEAFPLPVEGENSLELIENASMFDSDNDDEFDSWFEALQSWEFKHSWFSSRGGSYLPEVLFRKVQDKIEISWNNESNYSSEGITFVNPVGITYIPSEMFQSTVTKFVNDFLTQLLMRTKYKQEAEEFSEKIKQLMTE